MASYDDTGTVSGSIVRVNDGADSVPLKNWIVTLPASLDGYSEVNGKKSGKNISSVSEYPNNPWDFWGTNFTDMVSFLNTLKSGTYTISFDFEVETVPDSGDIQYGLPYIRALVGGSYVNLTSYSISTASSVSVGDVFRVSASFTLTDERMGNVTNCYLYCDRKDTHSGTGRGSYNIINAQIEVGSTATAYEPYEAPTTHTASLGRTIYGGTADLATGSGKDTSKTVKLSAFTWEYVTGEYSYGYFVRSGNVADMATNKNFQATGYINNGNPRSSIGDGEIGVYNNANAIRRPVIRDDSCTSLEQFLEKIADYDFVYECTNTPTSFTFTPVSIETSKGSNTFWSDQGNTELTYYKDGYGFTSVTVHKETPEGEPVEQTAKLHKIVYGGLIDVIQGKAEPKNLLKVTGEKTTYADITYTVNDKGQVMANGTATALRSFKVIKNGDPGFSFKKGVTYTLSGCPSGGSDQTYQLDLRNTNTVGTFFMNAKDYGNGVTFTPTEDAVAFPIILVRNGQVCDNLTFNPQIEVNSSKTEYVPHFEPFSFPPISMETDEGENTLYADEGDSAIVYRKAVE